MVEEEDWADPKIGVTLETPIYDCTHVSKIHYGINPFTFCENFGGHKRKGGDMVRQPQLYLQNTGGGIGLEREA